MFRRALVVAFSEEEFVARLRLLGRRLSRSDQDGVITAGRVVLDLRHHQAPRARV